MIWKSEADIKSEKFKETFDRKIAELKAACTNAIYEGFTSVATGFNFGFNQHDQENFTQQMLLIVASNGNYTDQIRWKTKEGTVEPLTVSKFISLTNEAAVHKTTQQDKYWVLEQQVLKATTVEEIEAVIW